MIDFGQLFRRSGSVGSGSLDVYNDFWYGTAGPPASSGKSVTEVSAMRLWVVLSCVWLISRTKAGMPLNLKRPAPGGGNEKAVDEPLYDLLKVAPNSEMTAFTRKEMQQAHLMLNGNSYDWIERSRFGVKALWPIQPKFIQKIRRAKTEELAMFGGSLGQIVYDVSVGGVTKTIPSRDMLHVVALSQDGYTGSSVITHYGKESVGNGLALDEFQGKLFRNGAHVAGIIKNPKAMVGDNAKNFRDALRRRYQGGHNVGVPMVLENGMEYQQLKVSLVDLDYLAQKKANALEICGIFGVPPSLVGIHTEGTSYNNTEMQNKYLLDYGLLHWLIREEAACNHKLLTVEQRKAGLFVKYNFDALLRASSKERAEIAEIESRMGMSFNRYLAREDRRPEPGGEVGRVQMNLVTVSEENVGGDQQKQRSCGCGNEHRTKNASSQFELRSLVARDIVAKKWTPIIKAAIKKIIRREVEAVKRQAERQEMQRSVQGFREWMNPFYEELRVIIGDNMNPIFRGYHGAMAAVVDSEVGATTTDDEVDSLSASYTKDFAARYIDSSRGQLIELAGEVEEDDFGPIIDRAEEWSETRADKVSTNEWVAGMGAVTALVFGAMGLKSVWQNRGTETCPYCESMQGKSVSSGGVFLGGGSSISLAGSQTFNVKKNTFHPPLHGGCDCYLRAE